MARNLAICCDGTNNSLAGNATNVRRIWVLGDLGDRERQLTYYDAGVGVEASPRLYTRIGGTVSRWSGSAFGSGLVANVQQAYEFLIQNYRPDDRIFLFGFSRGAYTVRVIAGLLENYGLLKPQHAGRAQEVVRAYRDFYPESNAKDAAAVRQQRASEAREIRDSLAVSAPVHFMGIFDTVSSLGWAWDPKTFPNTKFMPGVTRIRHALALDERRAKFRTNRIDAIPGKDHREVWFAGVHSDVGGGYEESRARLSRIPLGWMLAEAKDAGFLVNPAVESELNLEGSRLTDEQADQNESLSGFWRGLELLPLPHRKYTASGWVEGRRTYLFKGWRRICEPGSAHAGAELPLVHNSLQRRKAKVKNIHWQEAGSRIQYC